ncbi:hypothetical protein KY284_010842 [Solanum tuberosum]|nr:hypothetical protein KY284_010842 [Solanum tuberosum]
MCCAAMLNCALFRRQSKIVIVIESLCIGVCRSELNEKVKSWVLEVPSRVVPRAVVPFTGIFTARDNHQHPKRATRNCKKVVHRRVQGPSVFVRTV